MAPMKRRRQQEDESETDILDQESARASSEHRNKRTRVSSHGPAEEASSSDFTDEEIYDQQATQHMTERGVEQLENAPAENGILESVTCANFMCHEYFEVGLSPLINFIVGRNGSGKSAILAAITICLGGKATATNRGQSLKSFIKEGTEAATLSVKIRNKGDSAYLPELYRDSIIVERHFSRSGNSNFKLKNSAGRLISTKKADLEEICDYFALQIDNPVNVLTQDMARQFLSNSTPQEKYKFFMKGTQLEHLDGDYLQIEQSIDRIDVDLAKSLEDIGKFEEQARQARNLLALSDKQESLRTKIKTYGQQMAWAQVEEQERKVASYDQQLQKADDTILKAEHDANESSGAFDVANQAFEESRGLADELQSSLAPHRDQKRQVKQEQDKVKSEAMSLQTEQRLIKDHMKKAEARIKKAEDDINEEYRRLEALDGGSHARRLAEIEEKKVSVDDIKSRIEDHNSRFVNLEVEQKEARKALENSRGPITRKLEEVRECDERMKALLRDRGQRQSSYHPNLPRLLDAIRNDGAFREKPLGPIGNYVRLLKPQWSSVLEKSFGGALNTFIVTSKVDQTRLSDLMTRHSCQCPIMVGNNELFDIRNHEPDPKFDTTLRILEIDNELVKKQLIINHAIEQTILIENRAAAVETMSESRLLNVKQCYAHNIKHGEGLRLSYGWGGGLVQGHLSAFKGTPRMKTDIEYQISSCRNQLQKLKSELNDLEQAEKERQRNVVRCQQAIKRHGKESSELRLELQRAEDELEGLQDALDNDAIEEGRLDALKEHLTEAREELRAHQGSYEESVVSIDKAKESMRALRDQLSAIDVEIAEIEAKIRKAENKISKLSERREAALRGKNSAIADIDTAKERRDRLKIEREDVLETVTLWTEEASKISSRVKVDEGETCASLESKLAKLSTDLKKWEQRLGGTRQQIADDALAKGEAFRQAKEQVESIEKLAQLLKFTLVNRKDRWKFFQKAITARARVQFMWMLSERSFRGRLLANHKEKKLDLSVEPDETKLGKGREAKTLSGGEKSFSTISLLLALWDAMGAPVRCLDEFDVFMDSVNREVSAKMIVDAARCSIGKQFIIITPQSVKNVPHGPDVKIIQMRDPVRGQTTLPYVNA
ncbi:MAG: hypothetical protein LQ342_001340 [Letrouitia transgressa]|nr:MAG: hypothetical protein LQ342_001340 [Letrouitia transgressa]